MNERRDTGTPDKPIRIVVVEDSPIQRKALVDLFEEVYGMPKVAQEIGAVSLQQNPTELPQMICDWLGIRRRVVAR